MDYSKTPLWMQDDLVKDIPREKLDFLSKLFAQGHGKNQKEMMALLMPAIRKAKQEHLTFTPQEMQAAITAIKKYSTESELRQIENILEKSRSQKNNAFHHYVTTFVHKTAFTSWTYSIIKSCKHDFISLICPWLNYFATMLTILPGT